MTIMTVKYSELTEISQADSLISQPEFLIFKHSTQCPISGDAFSEFKNFLETDPEVPCYYVDVIKDRPVSQHIARILDVQHESPQVLYVKNGAVAFHTSHRRITKQAIIDALS